MANEQNLKGHEFTSDQNREEAAKNGRKGGIASGKARRERREMREALDELLSRNYESGGKQVDGTMALMAKTFQMALGGDIQAIRFIRETTGQDPVQRVETVEISPETYERVARVLGGE